MNPWSDTRCVGKGTVGRGSAGILPAREAILVSQNATTQIAASRHD
jgi:hypothetical protein